MWMMMSTVARTYDSRCRCTVPRKAHGHFRFDLGSARTAQRSAGSTNKSNDVVCNFESRRQKEKMQLKQLAAAGLLLNIGSAKQSDGPEKQTYFLEKSFSGIKNSVVDGLEVDHGVVGRKSRSGLEP
eukprot:Polyplicarium_translucidae@DN771_c0_g1_i1.p2